MTKMERYPAYKPTGIAWLPEVPEGWEIRPYKSIYGFGKGLPITKENLVDEGVPVVSYGQIHSKENTGISLSDSLLRFVSPSYLEHDPQCLLHIGDMAVADTSEDLDGCGNAVVMDRDGPVFAGYHTIISRIRDSRNAPFLAYVFKCISWRSQIRIAVHGVKLFSITKQILAATRFPLPHLPTQRAIVAYLDEKCGKIDALVAVKEKEAALLKELKQSMIAEAVTRGVRPKRRLVPSGIPWLPEVPEGWEVKTLRQFLKMVSRKGFPEKQLLSVTREQGVVVRNVESKEENHNFIPEDLSNYKLVEVGDFAINKMKSWQGSYGVSEHEGIVSPAYYICKLSGVDRSYFSAAIRSRPYVSFFARFSKGIRVDQWDLSPIALKEIPFLLPPLAEQREIVAHIEARAAKIDAAVKGLEREVAALKEYKQRLIADVVTGQRKVA